MKKILFVTYGSGHVRMVLPVARAVAQAGLAEPLVLGLTTAAPLVREAGLPLLQFRDFVEPGDEAALAIGRRLCAEMGGGVLDVEESVAYLGLCYAELERTEGVAQAAEHYRRDARQAFLPVQTLTRIVRDVAPDLVVTTNSPRAERAAVMAAASLGLPSVCLVDLFALDEVKWIGQPGFARQVCVLNESVREFLIDAGRAPHEVCVTGNPAFDALNEPGQIQAGRQWRRERGWEACRVLLWPTQVEPAVQPFTGEPGDTGLPAAVLQRVVQWTLAQPDVVLCVRPRAGEAAPDLPAHERLVVTGQDIELAPLLHAVDLVVTLNSTVGLQGHLCGTRLVQVLGSVFDHAMPLGRYGIADEAVQPDQLGAALTRWARVPRRPPGEVGAATRQVLDVIAKFL